MPTLNELKLAMEQALGDPNLRAEVYARPLRKAKLLTTGGRGSSTPQVSVTDCANLLIAIMAPGYAIHAAEAVKQYRSLELMRRKPAGSRGQRTSRPRMRQDLETLPLDRIREVHLLGQTIELLLLRAADGSLRRQLKEWGNKQSDQPGLSLRLIGPTPAATLRMSMLGEKVTFGYTIARNASHDRLGQRANAGLVRASEVYDNSIVTLGELFLPS